MRSQGADQLSPKPVLAKYDFQHVELKNCNEALRGLPYTVALQSPECHP